MKKKKSAPKEDKLIESKLKYFIHLILFSAFMYFLSIERDMWFYFFGAIYLKHSRILPPLLRGEMN